MPAPILRAVHAPSVAHAFLDTDHGLQAAASPPVPSWNGPALDYTKPLGGLKLVPGAQHVEIYHGGEVYGG